MFEDESNKSRRLLRISFFSHLPWSVRAFLTLLLIDLIAIGFFGLIGKWAGISEFSLVVNELTRFLTLIFGAVIGALSADAGFRRSKNSIDTQNRESPLVREDRASDATKNV